MVDVVVAAVVAYAVEADKLAFAKSSDDTVLELAYCGLKLAGCCRTDGQWVTAVERRVVAIQIGRNCKVSDFQRMGCPRSLPYQR